MVEGPKRQGNLPVQIRHMNKWVQEAPRNSRLQSSLIEVYVAGLQRKETSSRGCKITKLLRMLNVHSAKVKLHSCVESHP